ncbi:MULTISPECIES: ATP-binding protein [Streptomyces]|uniref:ATP-binding protein n=1 Tax=Streptomyces luteosporeus TaxID=173856 RepID=A0ABP6GEM8_9ACTN
MNVDVIRIATRSSPIALAQARHVQQLIRDLNPEVKTELLPHTTTADQWKGDLPKLGRKGGFVAGISALVERGEPDIADQAEVSEPAPRPPTAFDWQSPRPAGPPALCKRPHMSPDRLIASGVAPSREAVRDARLGVRKLLERWGLDDEAVFRAELITGELLANALQHAKPQGGAQIGLHLAFGGGELLIEVDDGGGPSAPAVRHATDDRSECGRGLALVEALAIWGYRTLPDGRRSTWAYLPASFTGARR